MKGPWVHYTQSMRGVGLAVLLVQAGFGQGVSGKIAFQTADVHVSAAGSAERGGVFPGGRFDLRGATMLSLIAIAYGVETDCVLGGPGWLSHDRFDVIAKAPSATASQEAMLGMLQGLLAERFQLGVHRDKKDLPVYLLTVGKNGPKLREAARPDEAAGCPRVDGEPGLNHRACHNSKIAALVELLPQVANNYVEHPVVDKTGLTGSYDFQLDWMGKGPYLAAKANPAGPQAVSIFDAVEKLGLKLELGTQPMSVIVVDRVNEKPTDNAPGVNTNIPTASTEFDAAEVRPSKPGGPLNVSHSENGRLDMQGFTLKGLISMGFEVEDDAVVGGPKWLDTDRFDVIAKAGTALPDSLEGMLKSLIVQRFKLAIHQEEQPLPVFALVLGKGAPRIKKSDGAARSDCKRGVGGSGITYTCQNTTMAQLAEVLPDVAGAYIVHPMVDLTGLPGGYDFVLSWTAKARLGMAATDLTVFEAVDRQLGLRLEERKHPRAVIVVDHVERVQE
jgi:uncharacterized protein (TIGR03435 family)